MMGPQLGAHSGTTLPSQEEMRRRERQLEGLDVVGRSPGSSPTPLLIQMAVEVGPLMTSAEVSHVRPIRGGRHPQRILQREAEEAQEVPPGDGCST